MRTFLNIGSNFGNIVKPFVSQNLLFRKVAMIVENRHIFCVSFVKFYPLHRRETLYANEKAIGFIDYINEHFAEQISLQSMAKNFGYSEGRCSYLFNTCVGVPFKTYLNQIRMQKAVELLSEKTLSVSEIMEKCGFNSSVTFYRQYRKFKETVSRSEKTE